MLEATEHALDGVAAFIEGLGEAAFPTPVRLGRDVRDRALPLDQVTDCIAVIGFVSEHDGAGRQIVQKDICGSAIGNLAAGQQEAERPAFAVGERMELAVAAAPADPDCLKERPPFPPPAERCAFICVLSIRTSAGGPPASARAVNNSCHTPFAAQRTKRL